MIYNIYCDEIVFKDRALAILFTKAMFKCSYIYTSDEDRYCMEYLARLLKDSIENRFLTEDDLYATESYVINKMCLHEEISKKWNDFCNFSKVNVSSIKKENYLKINAKHRYINPLVNDERIIDTNKELLIELREYLKDDFNRYIKVS